MDIIELKPMFDWDLADLQENADWSVVELPWEFENGYVSFSTSDVKEYAESNGQDEAEQLIRLVVMKNKSTGDIYGFKMVIIPDLNYTANQSEEIEVNTYLNKSSDLSGYVMFYSLADEFINGWQYADGQVVNKIEEADPEYYLEPEAADSANLRSIGWNHIVIEKCSYYMTSIDGGNTWSDPRLMYCRTEIYNILVDDGSRDGGGVYIDNSGGGGSNNNNNNNRPPRVSLDPRLKELFKGEHDLDTEYIEKLNYAFNKMKKECFYDYIDYYLRQNNVQLRNIYIAEPGWYGQAAITSSDDLKFADISQITAYNLKHEWIHLYQKQFHNINRFGKNLGMVEFELALIQDILKFIEIRGDWENTAYSWACTTTTNYKHQQAYMDWLLDLTNNGTAYPTTIKDEKFQEFSEAFGDVSISYNTSRGYTYGDKSSYKPSAIQSLFSRAKSYCNKK